MSGSGLTYSTLGAISKFTISAITISTISKLYKCWSWLNKIKAVYEIDVWRPHQLGSLLLLKIHPPCSYLSCPYLHLWYSKKWLIWLEMYVQVLRHVCFLECVHVYVSYTTNGCLHLECTDAWKMSKVLHETEMKILRTMKYKSQSMAWNPPLKKCPMHVLYLKVYILE